MKQFRVILMPVVMLVWLWPAESWASRPLILRVDQSLMIQSIAHPGYRLQGARATLAQISDRLDQWGAGIQTGDGAIVLALDTQSGSLKIAPHSRLRITQIVPQADGSHWFYLTIEQGQAQLVPAVVPGRSTDPATVRSLGGMRAAIMVPGWHG